MDIFLKTTAGVMIAVVLSVILAKQGKDLSVLLVLAVCAMVAVAAMGFIGDVIEFLRKLESIGNLNHDILTVLMKCVGISMLAEITALVCSDSGNAAMGKVLLLLATAVILWLSIPIFEELIELAEDVLGAV